MFILKKNNTASFEIVPRKFLSGTYFLTLKSEFTQAIEVVECTVTLLANKNYTLNLATFPISKVNEKFSVELKDNLNEVVLRGQLMVVDENEDIQNYTKQKNTKYYT